MPDIVRRTRPGLIPKGWGHQEAGAAANRQSAFRSLLLLLCSSLQLLLGPAGAEAAPPPIRNWESLVHPLQISARQVAVQAVSLADRRIVFEHQADQHLLPASLLKVVTSFVALKRLGPYYHFTTEVFGQPGLKDGTLPGNIWIKGNGDPYLVPEKLYLLAQKIRETGVRRINGGIGVDNGYFQPVVERFCLDGLCDRPYNPVVCATALNFNTVSLLLRVSEATAASVPFEVFPHGDYVLLDNQVKAGVADAETQERRIEAHPEGLSADGRERIRLSGQISASSGEVVEVRVNANDPVSFLARSLKTILGEMGVSVRGGVQRVGTVPANAHKLAEYQSPPLKDILYGLNRYSNNFMAEMLLRALGAEEKGIPGSAEKGVAVVGETLAALGIAGSDLELAGGSGLSRQCRLTVRALTSVLVAAYHDPEIGPEFVASLATGGEEGTLRRRGKRLANPSRIRGKTGSLSDVVGFAGYVANVDGRIHALV
ncbi:MAG TPA: D-alanyl-D-alanine carboxypeptidase/D-alanyl-D-alanine-endopeptidase, partial [Syntrophobacteraceae bacterium]|nr:D-alanyl-D-alanine carboxypeptidase/D-alanyl-D-alanine-endopeptidase [Syntrophobacteraceae bacterium]